MSGRSKKNADADADESQKPAEIELDIIIALELATGSPAAKMLWDAVGESMPLSVQVNRQVKRKSDGRTTDVQAIGGGFELLCEDKLADGQFQPDQLDGYMKEVANGKGRIAAFVIAPEAFIKRMSFNRGVKGVAVEALVKRLESAAAELDAAGESTEQAASYRYRARVLQSVCESRAPNLSSPGVAFREAYTEQAMKLTGGRVRLTEDTLTLGGGFAEFATGYPAPRGFKLMHKLKWGYLDVKIPGLTLEELSSQVDGAMIKPPPRWCPAKQDNARGNDPVLRYKLDPLQPITRDMDPNEAKELGIRAAEIAAIPAAEIGRWLSGSDAIHLQRPTLKTLMGLIDASQNTARRLGRNDIAASLAEIAAGAKGE